MFARVPPDYNDRGLKKNLVSKSNISINPYSATSSAHVVQRIAAVHRHMGSFSNIWMRTGPRTTQLTRG